MAKKRTKVFIIQDEDGILGFVLAASRKVFENKCKKAGFEIRDQECCGECDGCGCAKNKGLVFIPTDKFIPVTEEDMASVADSLPEGMTPEKMKFQKVMFGSFPIIASTAVLAVDGGCMLEFVEIDPIVL
jgi:hypothetical protein